MATREDYAKLHKELSKAGAPRTFMAVQPHQLHSKRREARERHGISAARALQLRFKRKEFGKRELQRRLAQAWASV